MKVIRLKPPFRAFVSTWTTPVAGDEHLNFKPVKKLPMPVVMRLSAKAGIPV